VAEAGLIADRSSKHYASRASIFGAARYGTVVRVTPGNIAGSAAAQSMPSQSACRSRQKHQNVIDALIAKENPFTNFLRCFKRLDEADPTRAETFNEECTTFVSGKSPGPSKRAPTQGRRRRREWREERKKAALKLNHMM
jgi:hypothetical protein